MNVLTTAALSRITALVQLGWHSLEMRRIRKRLAERDEENNALRALVNYWQEVADGRLQMLRARQPKPVKAMVKVVQFEHQRN